MSLEISMFLCLLLMSLVVFTVYHKYLLITLMSLEFIVVTMVGAMVMSLENLNLMYLVVYYMVFSVCEGVLGLSLLVIMVRFSGQDYLGVSSMLKW